MKVVLILRYQMAAGDGGPEKKKPLTVGGASAVLLKLYRSSSGQSERFGTPSGLVFTVVELSFRFRADSSEVTV